MVPAQIDFWPPALSSVPVAVFQLLILLPVCTGQEKTTIINAPSTPTAPFFFIWWWFLTGSKVFFFFYDFHWINFLSCKTCFGSSGSKTPNPASCCRETTGVICVLSECITDSDTKRERRRRWGVCVCGEGQEEKWITWTSTLSLSFLLSFSNTHTLTHTLHYRAWLTCFDFPVFLSLSFARSLLAF